MSEKPPPDPKKIKEQLAQLEHMTPMDEGDREMIVRAIHNGTWTGFRRRDTRKSGGPFGSTGKTSRDNGEGR